MKLAAALLSVVALTMTAPSASAQAKPNFAAKWLVHRLARFADIKNSPKGSKKNLSRAQRATAQVPTLKRRRRAHEER